MMMLSKSLYVTPAEQRRTPEGLRVVREVANWIAKYPDSAPVDVFDAGRHNVRGFTDLYARRGHISHAASRFRNAFVSDVAHWVNKGHSDLSNCKLGSGSSSTAIADDREEEEETEESSEFDADEFKKLESDVDAIDRESNNEQKLYEEEQRKFYAAIESSRLKHVEKTTNLRGALLMARKTLVGKVEKKNRYEARQKLLSIIEQRKTLDEEEKRLKALLGKRKSTN